MRPLSVAFFEHVAVSPQRALLRVAGRVDPDLASGGEPSLLLDDGRRAHPFTAVDAPDKFDPASGAFVLPFSVPADLLSSRVAYALQVGGQVLDLPAPRERKLARRPAPPAPERREAAAATPAPAP